MFPVCGGQGWEGKRHSCSRSTCFRRCMSSKPASWARPYRFTRKNCAGAAYQHRPCRRMRMHVVPGLGSGQEVLCLGSFQAFPPLSVLAECMTLRSLDRPSWPCVWGGLLPLSAGIPVMSSHAGLSQCGFMKTFFLYTLPYLFSSTYIFKKSIYFDLNIGVSLQNTFF